MVFGSNMSASSWESFRRAIQSLIPVLSMRTNLVEKHKCLLDMLVWGDDDNPVCKLLQAFKCPLNPGALDQHGLLEALHLCWWYLGLRCRKAKYFKAPCRHLWSGLYSLWSLNDWSPPVSALHWEVAWISDWHCSDSFGIDSWHQPYDRRYHTTVLPTSIGPFNGQMARYKANIQG